MNIYKEGDTTHGSGEYPEQYSVLSPNKSSYSHNMHYNLPPTYQPYTKENHNQFSYFPNIVQDLLNGTEEWRNIQDIIKMTLKAL